MKHIPKYNIYEEPEGYFDNLSERIIHKRSILNRQMLYTRMAAAAVLVIGIALFIFKKPIINEVSLQAEMDQEVELYINSGYWNAEDVLIFSENPDELLDAIIAEEWSTYTIKEDSIEEEIWY
ncbi:MAG: hypothetical protein WD426_10460 [Anditalea sp.]